MPTQIVTRVFKLLSAYVTGFNGLVRDITSQQPEGERDDMAAIVWKVGRHPLPPEPSLPCHPPAAQPHAKPSESSDPWSFNSGRGLCWIPPHTGGP